MKTKTLFFLLCLISFRYSYPQERIRQMVDSVGFTSKAAQMDALMTYMSVQEKQNIDKALKEADADETTVWKSAVCPHDDYTYVGYLYPALLQNVKAKTIFIIGVCHKAKQFNLENKIIFDSFTAWKMPYGLVRVPDLREQVMSNMRDDYYIVHDSVQAAEHSVEAIIPFLQYYNKDVRIVSILVPYMPFGRMNEISENLAYAIYKTVSANNLEWGNDYAVIISNDAVHYGDEDWGGKNYAPYGVDSAGYKLAVNHEYEIINECLTGKIETNRINKFTQFTVKDENFRDYKWTWCGRYSVPFGLLTTFYLQNYYGFDLRGILLKYATSIDHPHIPVGDINMGVTAPAFLRHWVGYAAIGYK